MGLPLVTKLLRHKASEKREARAAKRNGDAASRTPSTTARSGGCPLGGCHEIAAGGLEFGQPVTDLSSRMHRGLHHGQDVGLVGLKKSNEVVRRILTVEGLEGVLHLVRVEASTATESVDVDDLNAFISG